MTCAACLAAEADPLTLQVNRACRECGIRLLAGSPAFYRNRNCKLLREADEGYRSALFGLLGDSGWAEAHAKVCVWHTRIQEARAARLTHE